MVSVLQKPAGGAGVHTIRRYPAQVWAELLSASRERGHRRRARQHDVVVHKGDQRPGQVLEQLQATARKCALSVAVQFVLAADTAVLRQPQHGLDVDPLDRRLIARIDHEDLDRVLLLEHEVGDDRGQHRSAFGQDANLDSRCVLAR